jgi:hypothetical protein
MPPETEAQKRKVARVMHEFKEGDLKSGSGQKVRDPKQAIAIGLSEAGISRNQTRSGGEQTLAELYKEARRRDIPGRSRMNKAALKRALNAR